MAPTYGLSSLPECPARRQLRKLGSEGEGEGEGRLIVLEGVHFWWVLTPVAMPHKIRYGRVSRRDCAGNGIASPTMTLLPHPYRLQRRAARLPVPQVKPVIREDCYMWKDDGAVNWHEVVVRLTQWVRRRVADPDDVDDLVQDILERLVRHGERLVTVGNPLGWMHRIAVNTIICSDFWSQRSLRSLRSIWLQMPREA